MGLDRADDAGVYLISEETALIQTVDFFTPIVDDPYRFGQIAAANALSDVYAMGGIPKTAMNLVAFPAQDMDLTILRQIIQGGMDKLAEAKVALIGGHSIEDQELKYGLSVTGIVHPKRILTKKTLRAGDRLVLTKPLGTGIINTAIKAGLAPASLTETVTRLMAELNRDAAKIMADFDVSACTDITGFGLLGHVTEMISGSNKSVRIIADQVPLLSKAMEYANMGFIPAGAYKNKEFRNDMIICAQTVSRSRMDVLFDPQTSGGLLIGVHANQGDALTGALKDAGIRQAAQIGEVLNGPSTVIQVE